MAVPDGLPSDVVQFVNESIDSIGQLDSRRAARRNTGSASRADRELAATLFDDAIK